MVERVNVLPEFWIELCCANFSAGLQNVEAGEGCCYALGRGSAFWRDDKRPCIIQWELSTAPVLPGI